MRTVLFTFDSDSDRDQFLAVLAELTKDGIHNISQESQTLLAVLWKASDLILRSSLLMSVNVLYLWLVKAVRRVANRSQC